MTIVAQYLFKRTFFFFLPFIWDIAVAQVLSFCFWFSYWILQ